MDFCLFSNPIRYGLRKPAVKPSYLFRYFAHSFSFLPIMAFANRLSFLTLYVNNDEKKKVAYIRSSKATLSIATAALFVGSGVTSDEV